ncbi:MAG: hypothetical protein ALAOOOJD_00615 [bacterium]|nr:hypothetical protein [bacterium]
MAVRAECNLTAVVIGVRLIELQHDLFTQAVGFVRICHADAITRNHRPARRVCGIVDEKIPVVFVIGMKRQSQQAFFITAIVNAVFDVQKSLRYRHICIIFENFDDAGLLNDKQPVGAVAGLL